MSRIFEPALRGGAPLAALGKPYFFCDFIGRDHGLGANIKENNHPPALERPYFLPSCAN